MREFFAEVGAWIATVLYVILVFVGIPVAAILGIICLSSLQARGGGQMDAYVVKTERIGDRVFIKVKDSVDASNTYEGCVATEDEQKFKDIIGKRVALEWDGVFSLTPFWTECPAPVRIKESREGR